MMPWAERGPKQSLQLRVRRVSRCSFQSSLDRTSRQPLDSRGLAAGNIEDTALCCVD